MAWFPDDMPRPQPTLDDAGFWARCAERSLCFQCCADCGLPRHPPTPLCARCHSARQGWLEAPAQAFVYSFTVVRHATHPAVADRLPYVVAVVEFAGLPQVRLVSNVTDVDPATVHIGMPLQLWWDKLEGEPPMVLPRFRPAP